MCIDDGKWDDNSKRYEVGMVVFHNRYYLEAFSRHVILVVSVLTLSQVPEQFRKLEYFGSIYTLKPPTEQERRQMLVSVYYIKFLC